ncbi:hypothetical protein PG994_014446 [Apiospora phragmitis]|uniref:Uncharacterized protein n=1 Tax=Apiospora phragmitis TaxID=2905665 RepID=A0ABR1T4C5_9PEZI
MSVVKRLDYTGSRRTSYIPINPNQDRHLRANEVYFLVKIAIQGAPVLVINLDHIELQVMPTVDVDVAAMKASPEVLVP